MEHSTPLAPTDGAKMLFPIKRRTSVSHVELVAHWFANHMPNVIRAQADNAKKGRPHAARYLASLFDPDRHGAHPWDGMAQLWFAEPLATPKVAHGTTPVDSFQERAEPYLPWATTEYVILDGAEHLASEPLTLGAPFPTTRSGFHKMTFLVAVKDVADCDRFFDHWLSVHVPNVANVMTQVGGFRYVVSHSLDPQNEKYAGVAEMYFHDEAGWAEYQNIIEADGMQRWLDHQSTIALRTTTEMIGIP